jgi:hypothetical protein
MAGITGPCPQCNSSISSPHQEGFPKQTVQPSYAQDDSQQFIQQQPLQQLKATGEAIRPEPRLVTAKSQRPEEAHQQVEAYVRVNDQQLAQNIKHTSRAGVSVPSMQKKQKSVLWLRLLIPLLIFLALGKGFFTLVKFLKDDRELTTNQPPLTARSSIEETIAQPAIPKDSELPAIQITPIINPTIDKNPPVAETNQQPTPPLGHEASALLKQFLSAKTFAERKELIFSKKPPNELANSILNRPWPISQISPGSVIPHPAEQLVEYYYEVRFRENSMNFPKSATVLIQQRGNEPPKIIAEPIIDCIGGALVLYAKNPQDQPRDFHVIMDARINCYQDTIPNAAKKSTFYFRAHYNGDDLAIAYANQQSETRQAFNSPLEGLKWKNPIPVVVTLQWNTIEDPKRPFLEVIEIKAKDWNP